MVASATLVDTESVKKALAVIGRWIYIVAVSCAVAYLAAHFVERTYWYKERLYRKLVNGQPREQVRAAAALARLEGEEQLLDALRAESQGARDLAQRALEHIWFYAAGDEAYQLTQTAFHAAEENEFDEALDILNQVIRNYPTYAEAWNRRASVYWQMGQFEKSIADCEHTLDLNANHYGAWQGIGVCQLELGQLVKACEALRAALRIRPFDESTARSLRRCEDLLRVYPHPEQAAKTYDLI